MQIAIVTNRTAYDSLYLALAVELSGVVVTADDRWVNTLANGPFARFIRLIGGR